jgi:hypothetical protein
MTAAQKTKMLVVVAVALGRGFVTMAAPAHADPNSVIDPNPFGGLSCDCRVVTPSDSVGGIRRGLREGLTVSVPGLPALPHRP